MEIRDFDAILEIYTIEEILQCSQLTVSEALYLLWEEGYLDDFPLQISSHETTEELDSEETS